MTTLYDMIYKRRSFHLFRGLGGTPVTAAELEAIATFWEGLTPLCPGIQTAMRILPASEVTNRQGQEYCLAFYSEKKGNYLHNIGYLGQMMELYLVSLGIGTCWYGIGKAKESTYQGLDYVIMIAFSKVKEPAEPRQTKFRQDLFKAKRKPVEEIWQGAPLAGVTDIARFAPSACNSQPWRVERAGNTLQVYRYHKSTRIGIMSPENARYFNRIDMGIYLCFLALCLRHEGIDFAWVLHPDAGGDEEKTPVATVILEGDNR